MIFWIQRQFAEMALSPRSSVSCSSLCSNLHIDCSTPQGALPLLFHLMQTLQSAAQEQGFLSISVHFRAIPSHIEEFLRLFLWKKKLDNVLFRMSSRFLHTRQFHALSNRADPRLSIGMRSEERESTRRSAPKPVQSQGFVSRALLSLPIVSFPSLLHRRCKRACDAESLITVQELPPILAIHLAQPHQPLDLPLTLDFAQFCSLVGLDKASHCRTDLFRTLRMSWPR